MFDPLDLYTPDEIQVEPLQFDLAEKELEELSSQQQRDGTLANVDEKESDDDDTIIDNLDLPSVRYAPPEVILCILVLLRPNRQVNFNQETGKDKSVLEICESHGLEPDLLKRLLGWYTEEWPNKRLNSLKKICNKIPMLRFMVSKELLLSYYTSVLKKYNNCCGFNDETVQQLLKELSSRISENCGRTAQPSIIRYFELKNLTNAIPLYEPSLTADNLGWKTWGSSLILSQLVVDHLLTTNLNFAANSDTKQIKVLELGAGTGLVGLSWALKWRELHGTDNIEIFVTDLPEIVTNLKKNVSLNNLQDFVQAETLDWTNPQSFIDKFGHENEFDIILVADPIYSPQHPEWVVNMISKFLAPSGTCHLEIPLRAKYAREREVLKLLLLENNFKVVEEGHSEGMDDWGVVKYLYRQIVRN
ncbi:S-adenosylmethionine-dependent methyltransferase [Saccharomyces paradoxus]|uniref:S-adenosylmethionine-dependent methyltransferase n=1 Tax=Saccharomyces paradoxus TaxID=27291 RepID=A0A8B8UM38_SACPA|nr:Efm2 [Saccharomyces paradoxus]QHS71828.1 Efm2 [Saccharomyces paradoxus]